jgi:hypothetical protein
MAYINGKNDFLVTLVSGGGVGDIQKYLAYYNYRIAEMTAECSQNEYSGGGTKKVLVLSRRGMDDNDFGYVTNGPFEGVTHVVYNPFRTGSLKFVDIAKTKWVLVPRGITSISLYDWGDGAVDLTAFGNDTPFPQLETSVGSVCNVIVPSGRDDIWEMTNWCDANTITEDVSEWFE